MTVTEELITHMRRVQVAERDLHDLGVVWQLIESSAAISCPDAAAPILPMLAETRERYDDLQRRLVERMVEESRDELGDELGAKAQCSIDILVRNLYERTADVGFLATDPVVRDFCAAPPEQRAAARAAMHARLAEYQAKYSVYDDVILLSVHGELLLRLAGGGALERSSDPLVADALRSSRYVERFGASDLGEPGAPALLYGHRIASAQGAPLGVLVLRFRFADELRRIFAGMADERQELALMLLDGERRVIATSDAAHVPLDARLPPLPPGKVTLISFAGREYLAVSCASAGYQGYGGPAGWQALAMVSLLTAFRARETGEVECAVQLEQPGLMAVQRDAAAINRELRRVVWNGRLMSVDGDDQQRLKAVLRQVTLAGSRTRERLDQAIAELSRTSLARLQHQACQLAALAADIMDRNLYERANDCRWWALSPVLRRALSGPVGDATELDAVLDHINGLYTVYSRLVAFDAQGCIRGASNAAGRDDLRGTTVPPAWLQAVQGLAQSQQYAVSPFEDTTLHDGGPTYVYLAAVRDIDDAQRLVGGIAIIFNAATELAAMLRDIIGARSGFAAFTDQEGRVLAASDGALAAGLAQRLEGGSAVLVHEGIDYACAAMRARGYREFKASDGYDNRVNAVVGLRIGAADRRQRGQVDLELAPVAQAATRAVALEAAAFRVGAGRYAISSQAVLEAVSPRRLVQAPAADGALAGLLEVGCQGGPSRVVPVLCARRLFGLNYPARAGDGVVLVLRGPAAAQPLFGLRVDDVLSVLEVPPVHLHPAPAGLQGFAPWIEGMIDCQLLQGHRGETVLVHLLALPALAARLKGHLPEVEETPASVEAQVAARGQATAAALG